MPFPEAPRVIYNKNTLTKVVCQLRYPPILKIDTEIPSLFQDAVRVNFPLYNEMTEIQQEIQFGPKSQIQSDLINRLTKTGLNKSHEFSTENNMWKIKLTRTSISISTSKYTRWEDFLELFQPAIKALLDIYSPPFFTRIGLRYINIFDRSKIGVSTSSWTELIQPYFLGLLSTEIWENVKHCENIYEVQLKDEISSVRILTSFVHNAKTNEQCYLVDSDFYTLSRLKDIDLNSQLEFLHTRSTRLIHWIITPKLHTALEPITI